MKDAAAELRARPDLAEQLELLAQHSIDAAYGGSIRTQDERLAAARAYRHAAALARASALSEARVREDDEDGPCPNCEDGCERCDPRFLSTDPEIPHNLARAMSRDKLLRPARAERSDP